ncbi:MAG: hypothetical protein JW940_13245 [Polyangiaceae bacterium]|nr:hypothetical protein [Polyangiaceae bacterium]
MVAVIESECLAWRRHIEALRSTREKARHFARARCYALALLLPASSSACHEPAVYGEGTPCGQSMPCRVPLVCKGGKCALRRTDLSGDAGAPGNAGSSAAGASAVLDSVDGWVMPGAAGGIARSTLAGVTGGAAPDATGDEAGGAAAAAAGEEAGQAGTSLTPALAGAGGAHGGRAGDLNAAQPWAALGGFGGSGPDDAEPTLKLDGEACFGNTECESIHCIDGVCCDSDCLGQCQTCAQQGRRGRCTVLASGQPVGKRTACTNAGLPCGGSCLGEPECSYPDETVGCRSEVGCVDRVTLKEGMACDGRGSCSVALTRTCRSPEVCNVNTDGDCGPPVYTEISAGEVHSCAVVSDGTLRCWGSNLYGQLGVDAGALLTTPRAVPGQENVKSVAVGWAHTCVLFRDGTVKCWGADYNGNIGCPNPTATFDPMQCTAFPSGSTVVEIAGGGEHACARKSDGTLECWGRNDYGAVGDGTSGLAASGLNPHRYTPVAVLGIQDAIAITTGIWHSCAVSGSGAVLCWGYNGLGNLGTGDTTDHAVPAPVVTLGDSNVGAALAVSASCCHTCALMQDGAIRCFGSNEFGQLGDGTTLESHVPVSVTGLDSATAVAVGFEHTCALIGTGSVLCWGMGTSGQLGQGADSSSLVPAPVELGSKLAVTAISSKGSHTCVLTEIGGIWCWGANDYGQLGDGTLSSSNVPVTVPMPDEL